MAADFEAAVDVILTRFKAQMDSLRPTLKIAWPNMSFNPASDYTPASHVGWARVAVLGGESRQASIGDSGRRRWRTPGVFAVQIFAPAERGGNTALAIADDVAGAMRGVTSSGVLLQAASIYPVGRDGAFWQVNVNVPFRFDVEAA